MKLNEPYEPKIYNLLISSGQAFSNPELGKARLRLSFSKKGVQVEAGATEPLGGALELIGKNFTKLSKVEITRADVICYLFGVTIVNMITEGIVNKEALDKLQEIFGDQYTLDSGKEK